ncbi:MAG: ECF transporter S component [Lachnospiraceae bacterium]|nr:ECF transporter S component [Lachnospiraceae bacterium]
MGTGLLQSVAENLQFVLVCVVVIAAIIGVSWGLEATVLKKNIAQVSKTRYITICGMLGAIAMVLHIFDFPLIVLAPSFYKLDFSEIPVMIGAFCLGPVGGVVIELVKILLKLIIKGTSTAFVGDLANFVVGCSFVVPAAIIYHLKKTRTTAIIGLAVGTVVLVVFGTMFNAFYLLPAFAELYGMPLDSIISMGTAINPAVNSVTTFVIICVAPLNLIKGICISIPTMILYKRISVVLRTATQDPYAAGRNHQPQG